MNAAAMMRLSAPPTQTRAGIRNAASDEDAAVDAGFAFLLASHRQRVAPDLDRGGSWREEIEDSTADEPREPDAAERGNETSGRPEEVGTDARGAESRNADGDSSGKPGASGSGLSWREDVRVVVLQAGPSKVGRWVSERRNLRDDYAKLFGEAPPRLEGVAIQCNSQHTESEGHGLIGEIVLAAE